MKTLIRLLSFFNKEINEIRRQPRLVLSLVLGPFLILLLFGVGYAGERPKLKTALVLPPEGIQQVNVEDLKRAIGTNFNLVSVDSNLDAAMAKLNSGEIEVVEILPGDVQQRVLRGEQAPVDFKYNEINPLTEQWIQYLGYAQVNEINRVILTQTTQGMQSEAGALKQLLEQGRTQLDALNGGLSAARQADTQKTIRQLKDASAALAASPLLASQISDGSVNPTQTRQQLLDLHDDLDALDQSISNGSLDQQQQRVAATRERIAQLEQSMDTLSKLPPQVLTSPLQQQYDNLHGQSLDFMSFYAPSVLALILQHIAITLGALSLVRERLLGALELFRVAPVSSLQVVLGKYLGYTLFIGVITAALVGLMVWPGVLGVPFLGDVLLFIGMVVLLTLASLGIGFLISTWSKSDSQAVQLSMLVLLLSIFFSGFFLPLENFRAPINYVGYALPLTHGINGFQSIMLRGTSPSDLTWLLLALIAGVTFVAVSLISQWQFRRVM
jgi:ABC-2 type transport system permease protein